ncbi:MAG: hypothetical protein PHP92_03610 [Candidatus Nanoarchaeia archaeon]|nr:hypothetical protein [Candidatus Nanoarchaeia archaeon]
MKKLLFAFFVLTIYLSCSQSKYDKLRDGYDVGFILKKEINTSHPYHSIFVYNYIYKNPYLFFAVSRFNEECFSIAITNITELWIHPHIKNMSRDDLWAMTNLVELDEWATWDSKHTIYLDDILKMTNN